MYVLTYTCIGLTPPGLSSSGTHYPQCSFIELVLVPLGVSKGLTTYVRGKA